MSHVLHRDLKRSLPVAVKGEGAYIIDSTGKRYLDASGGPAVSCLGHSHPKVIEAESIAKAEAVLRRGDVVGVLMAAPAGAAFAQALEGKRLPVRTQGKLLIFGEPGVA